MFTLFTGEELEAHSVRYHRLPCGQFPRMPLGWAQPLELVDLRPFGPQMYKLQGGAL
jgi:hypothetical protein